MIHFAAHRGMFWFALTLSVFAPILATPSATGQGTTAVSGWRPTAEADPFANPDPTSVTASVTPVGLSGLRVSVKTECYLTFNYFSFVLQLQGAAFDADKGTEVHSSPRIFGGTNVYSTNYNHIEYQARIDSGEIANETVSALDGADHSFAVNFNNDSLTQGRQALIGATSAGRPITLLINLRDPVLAHAIRLCTTARVAAEKEAAEAEAKKKQAEDDAKREEADKKAAEAAKLEAARLAAEKERQEAAAYLDKITVKGSPEEILAKLPDMFAAKAAELGDPPTSYAPQIAEIGKLLKACSDGSGATPGCNLPGHDFFSIIPDGPTPPFRHVWIGWSLHGGDMMLGPPTKAQPAYFILQAGVAQRVDGQAPFKNLSFEGLFIKQTVFRAYVPYVPPYSDKLGDAVHRFQAASNARLSGGGEPSTEVRPPATIQPSAKVQSDGSWTDPQTKLMWTTKNNPEDKVLVYAQQYCQVLRLGGFSDWRLPSIDQLKSLYDPGSSQTTPPLKSTILFPMRPGDSIPAGTTWTVHIRQAIHLDVPTVWSSAGSEPGSRRRASSFNFSNGKVTDLSPNYIANMRCLCVRGPS